MRGPPVLPVEVLYEAVTGPRQSWAPSKGTGALGCDLWKNDVKDLWVVLFLTEG